MTTGAASAMAVWQCGSPNECYLCKGSMHARIPLAGKVESPVVLVHE